MRACARIIEIDDVERKLKRSVIVRSRAKRGLIFFLMAMILASALNLGGLFSSPAFAEPSEGDSKAEKLIKEAAKNEEYDGEEGAEKLSNDLERRYNPKRNTFFGLVYRIVNFGYLNHTPAATPAKGFSHAPYGENDLNCDVSAKGKGTPIYHNCDVPNIFTEFFQDLYAIFAPSSVEGAFVTPSYVPMGVGLPRNVPSGEVPVKPEARYAKYTGLELYGYNAKMTVYNGEWDHIKVMTEARALANFGLMDGVKLGVNAVSEAVTANVNNVTTAIAEGPGAIFRAMFVSPFEVGASASINSIIDTSDLNVFNTGSWYRVGYGDTIYNGRELTNRELSALAQAQVIDAMLSKMPEEGEVPEELASASEGPSAREKPVAKCEVINDKDGKTFKEVLASDEAPGPGEEKCREAGAQAKVSLDADVSVDDSYKWSEDGKKKGQSVEEWKKENKKFEELSGKYNLDCRAPGKKDGDDKIAAYQACWAQKYPEASKEAKRNDGMEKNKKWGTDVLSFLTYYEVLRRNGETPFNSPEQRFVCTDKQGRDIRKGKDKERVNVYNSDGKVTPGCKPLRPPIQNGLMGNGYRVDLGQKLPEKDTRWVSDDVANLIYLFFPVTKIATVFGNGGLAIAGFATIVSNTFMSMTWSPILGVLGLDDIIVSLVESLRDGIFFPLAALAAAVLGVGILVQAAKSRDTKRQLIAVVVLVLNFALGVVLMANPKETIETFDKVPSAIETAVVGAVFGNDDGNGDVLCTATGKADTGDEIKGDGVSFNPSNSVRTLMCENWRAFYFNPYIFGQWGTTYDQLYAKGHVLGEGASLKNTNQNLVGTADVNMGGGTTSHNWGLYQVDLLTAGTTTTFNHAALRVTPPPDFYRIVDAQMGPNNGAGTDNTYSASWRGQNIGDRLLVGLLSGGVAILGAITVITYTVMKIAISLLSSLMLIVLPIMFLLGMLPVKGPAIMRAYFGTILGLFLQRIMLIVLLAVMFKILVASATAADSYLLNAVVTIAVCIVFLLYRSGFMGLIRNSVTSSLGDVTQGRAFTALSSMRNAVTNSSEVRQAKSYATGLVGGTLGAKRAGVDMTTAVKQGHLAGELRRKQQTRRLQVGNKLNPFVAMNETAKRAQREAGYDEETGANTRSARKAIRNNSAEEKLRLERQTFTEDERLAGENLTREILPQYAKRESMRPHTLGDSRKERASIRKINVHSKKIEELREKIAKIEGKTVPIKSAKHRHAISKSDRRLREVYREVHGLESNTPVQRSSIRKMLDDPNLEKKLPKDSGVTVEDLRKDYAIAQANVGYNSREEEKLDKLKEALVKEQEALKEAVAEGTDVYDREVRRKRERYEKKFRVDPYTDTPTRDGDE